MALHWALANRNNLQAIGSAGRWRAEQRFDGRSNDRAIADLALELAADRAVVPLANTLDVPRC